MNAPRPATAWNLSETPPSPRREPTVRTLHGEEFTDHYEWLRDRDSAEVIAHLEAENRYTESVTAGQERLREEIFGEIRTRTQETDLSVPVRSGGWWTFRRMREGSSYPVFCRVPAQDTGDLTADWTPPEIPADRALDGEEVLLDCNALAEPLPFFSLGFFSLNTEQTLLTYSVDDSGDERYTQYVKDLRTGKLLEDRLEEVFAGGFLTPDGRFLIYTLVDPTWRPCEIRAHRIGAPTDTDASLLREEEPTMWLGCSLAPDESALIFESGNSERSEVRLLPLTDLEGIGRTPQKHDDAAAAPSTESASDPAATPDPASGPTPWTLIPRTAGVLAEAAPVTLNGTEHLIISLDHQAPDGQLVAVSAQAARAASSFEELTRAWTPLLPPRDGRRVESFTLNATHLAVSLREDTIPQVGFLPLERIAEVLADPQGAPAEGLDPEIPPFDQPLRSVGLVSMSRRSPVVGLSFTSWTTPARRFDYFPQTGSLELRRQTPVLGGFDERDYTARREWAPAEDGTLIPLSVIHRADLDLETPHPVLQYGYGSYEMSMDPAFSIPRLSLLDRGVVYVVAHVRGGGELGRNWYLDGKKRHKRNTFTDFIAATDWIAAQPWADPARIAASGGSAGGLLMGAVANMAPEKYCGILAVVPFVDPVTSIADPELPLSALEWEEWGNPITSAEDYAYMRSYAPYENIAARPYPPIAAVTSLNDTRVLYVEPAKWVPVLREHSTSGAPVLLRTEMDGGHGGGSGRYQAWKDTAWEYAFLLTCLSEG